MDLRTLLFDRRIPLGRHVPLEIQSIAWNDIAGERRPVRSNSTGDAEFDAEFRVDPKGASAPAFLHRATRQLLLSWIDQAPIVIQDDRLYVEGVRPDAADLARLHDAFSGHPNERLARIIRDAGEPLVLRVWAYDAMPIVAGLDAARELARALGGKQHPAMHLRSARVLDAPELLRKLATDSQTPVAVACEAIVELERFPGPANRTVVLHAIAGASGELVAGAVALARSSGLDARTLLAVMRPTQSEAACEAFARVFGELGDPAATDFLIGELSRPQSARTRVAVLDALAECAPLESLEKIRAIVDTFYGGARLRGDQAIAQILDRAGNPEPGRLAIVSPGGGELAVAPESGALSET